MEAARAARRELALVLALATGGIALALLVAFTPWYEPAMVDAGRAAVGQTYPPAPVSLEAVGTG